MKKSSFYLSALALSLTLAACQDTNEGTNETSTSADEQPASSEEQEAIEVDITGLGDHYHTGDTVELAATVSGSDELDHWHWYTKETGQNDWEVASGQEGDTFSMEAADGLEVKAVLYGDDHEVAAESDPVTIVIDDHHGHDEESKLIYQGYFDDEQVADRELSDWEGDWQSVYPYLQNGDLDDVFAHKAEEGDMTAEEYKDHYTTGYETDVERITIDNGHVTFYENDQEYSGDYAYDGYEILTYEKGNRGVRFIYSLTEEAENMPQYIQFSDHIIAPQESSHYHLYWGDDREELLDEVEHWPTYYPSSLDADGIVRDQLAH